MKKFFSLKAKHVDLNDKERMILEFLPGGYYDIHGNPVKDTDGLVSVWEDDEMDELEDPWNDSRIEDEGISEPLIPESTTKPEWEIDDAFGNFGFKNREGIFVIEPQYAYAYLFSHGLAAVNLNRTWFRGRNGSRYYENHFGYINERGETVIPFAYDEAYPFNKYGVAVVEDRKGSHLIDTNGVVVKGTESFRFCKYYEYDDRYFKYWTLNDDNDLKGIYDTKERRIILEPSVNGFDQWWGEDIIRVTLRNGKMGGSDFHKYFIDNKGQIIYPWLKDKGFAYVEKPNNLELSIVSVSEYHQLPDDYPSGYYLINSEKYDRTMKYGIYSSKERFVLPLEYDDISELTESLYACHKDGMITIMQLENSDLR
ncbi:MAG: WG repeat-containing protein [Erysipelotrichaceae bacterium]|nr:WG repeat-containing protein [Erysipelotrichaceae bacterium]